VDVKRLVEHRQDWIGILDRTRTAWRKSRFGEYVDVVDELVQLDERRKLDPDVFRYFRENLLKQEMLFEGASQLLQLQISSKVWDNLDARVLEKKMRKILSGRPLPSMGARSGADEPRDTLVELLAASLMANCGFEPGITENKEDLRLHLEGRSPVLAECKRPVGESSVPTAIAKVRNQLWIRSKGDGPCLAVFAVERIHGFTGLLKATSSEEVDGEVARRMKETIAMIRQACADRPRCRLAPMAPVGLVIFSAAVFVKEATPYLYPFTRMDFFDTGDEIHVPTWLLQQLRQDGGLLQEFGR
jgi:hypothetical protein